MIGPAIRKMVPEDVTASLAMRARTRENAVDLEELREVYGITPATAAEALRTRQTGFLLEDRGAVAGFCIGDRPTGEVVVLALLPDYEGQGWGRHLLTLVHEVLIAEGHKTIWLWASADPAVRATGFYARFGYVPTGETEHGDVKLAFQVQ